MFLLLFLVVLLFVVGIYNGVDWKVGSVLLFLWIMFLTLAGPYLLSGGTFMVLLCIVTALLLGVFTYFAFTGGWRKVGREFGTPTLEEMLRGEDDE